MVEHKGNKEVTYGPPEPEVSHGVPEVSVVIRGKPQKVVPSGEDPQEVDHARVVLPEEGPPTAVYGGPGGSITPYEAGLISPEMKRNVRNALNRGREEKKKKREATKKKVEGKV
jgi:hypothetical protein